MSSYCTQCGKLLKDAAKFCPRCGTPVEAESRCPHCGAAVEDDSTYCMNCGCWLANTPAPPKAAPVTGAVTAVSATSPGICLTEQDTADLATAKAQKKANGDVIPETVNSSPPNCEPAESEKDQFDAPKYAAIVEEVKQQCAYIPEEVQLDSGEKLYLPTVTVNSGEICFLENESSAAALNRAQRQWRYGFDQVCFAENRLTFHAGWLLFALIMSSIYVSLIISCGAETSWLLIFTVIDWMRISLRKVTLYLKDGSQIQFFGKDEVLAALFESVKPEILKNGDNPRLIGLMTGKAESYYGPEFNGAWNGRPVCFNVSAFLFGPLFCFYRRCTEMFVHIYLCPICLMAAAIFCGGEIVLNSTHPFATIYGFVLPVCVSIWTLIIGIRFGRSFNALYYQHCWKNRVNGTVPAEPTSALNAFLYMLVCSLAAGCVYAAVFDSNFPGDLGDDDLTEDASEAYVQSPEPAATAALTPAPTPVLAPTPVPAPTKAPVLIPKLTPTPEPDPGPDERTDVNLAANNGTWYGEDGGTLDFDLEYLDDTRTKARITITFDHSNYYHIFNIETSFIVPDANEMIYYKDNVTEGGWGGNYSIVIELAGGEIYFSAYPDEYTTENCGYFGTFDSYRLTR